MLIEDAVYGDREIEEEVLKELIDSRPFQRLKNIHQAGPQPFFMDKYPMTRYEHSLGVMLLLRDHGASLEEQIAGLLHDVPHTAFSHMVDFVYDTDEHDYHDRFLEKIVKQSEIPEILEKHGLDVDYILDEENFGLLERDAPDLCADRIDYFLRDSQRYGDWKVDHFADSLTAVGGMFVLDGRELAIEYGKKYAEADEEWWANPKEVILTEILAKAVKEALEQDVLTEEELFGTDEQVMEKLRNSDNELIQEKLELLDNGFEIELEAENPDMEVATKARAVDPPVTVDGEVREASEFSDELKKRIKEHKEFVKSGYSVNIKEK